VSTPRRAYRPRRPVGPNQHVTILVRGPPLYPDDLPREVVEGVIIELELPFERAIGHAAATLQDGHGLIHNVLEGQCRPPCCGAGAHGWQDPRGGSVTRREQHEYTRTMEEWNNKILASVMQEAVWLSGGRDFQP